MPSVSYTVTLSSAITDMSDNALAQYSFSFNTGTESEKDITPPTISATTPANGASNLSLNASISATFSEVLDCQTVTKEIFTLVEGPNKIDGTVSCSGSLVSFQPAASLTIGKSYSATLKAGLKDSVGLSLAADYSWSFTPSNPDTTLPTVSSVSPTSKATGVPINKTISVVFSEEMASSTISTASFWVKEPSGNAIGGAVTLTNLTASFKPSSNLTPNTTYTVVLSPTMKDTAGNALAEYTWSFTTSSSTDTSVPTVVSVSPQNDSTLDASTTTSVYANFSENMDPATFTTSTFTISEGSNKVTGSVICTSAKAMFTASYPFTSGKTYTAKIASSVKDLDGLEMGSDYSWSFKVINQDSTIPTVTWRSPDSGATSVAVDASIQVFFSEYITSSTMTSSNIVLSDGTSTISGTIDFQNVTLKFTPSASLTKGTTYTFTLKSGITDLAGNALTQTSWTFTTVSN